MSPSSTSEARKRREGDTEIGPTPLPGYVLTTRGEAARFGWECIDLDDVEQGDAGHLEDLAEAAFDTRSLSMDPWLVIARPPRPRTVTIELPEDMRDRWAVGLDIPAGSDLLDIIAACRASRDAEQ